MLLSWSVLDEFVERKRKMGKQYDELLKNVSDIQLPLAATQYAENIYWVYGVVLEDQVPFDAEEAIKRLASQGIGTRPFFWPLHKQPVFEQMGLFRNTCCPAAERLARRGFYLPSGLRLTAIDIDHVARGVGRVFSCRCPRPPKGFAVSSKASWS